MSSVVIAGDTSGTITLQAPAVAGSTTINLPATTGTLLNDATVGVCRAWVNFNGTGTVAIRASFNVSSITDNGTGNYKVNFTNALPDANYSFNGTSAANSSNLDNIVNLASSTTPTTSSFQITVIRAGVGVVDTAYVNVSVFR